MKRIKVYFEGNDDKNVLDELNRAKQLPASLEWAERKGDPGKDSLVAELLPFVTPVNGVGGSAVVLVDFDDNDADSLADWFGKLLRSKLSPSPAVTLAVPESTHPRLRHFTLAAGNESGHVVLCPVGVPEVNPVRGKFHLHRFAMDEYLLRLVLNRTVYEQVSDFKQLPYETAVLKIEEVGRLFHDNGIDVTKSKPFLHIVRAAAQMGAGSAALTRQILSAARQTLPPDDFRSHMNPLIDDLHAAVAMLTPSVAPG